MGGSGNSKPPSIQVDANISSQDLDKSLQKVLNDMDYSRQVAVALLNKTEYDLTYLGIYFDHGEPGYTARGTLSPGKGEVYGAHHAAGSAVGVEAVLGYQINSINRKSLQMLFEDPFTGTNY